MEASESGRRWARNGGETGVAVVGWDRPGLRLPAGDAGMTGMCSVGWGDVFSFWVNVFTFRPNVFSFWVSVFTFEGDVFSVRRCASTLTVPIGRLGAGSPRDSEE